MIIKALLVYITEPGLNPTKFRAIGFFVTYKKFSSIMIYFQHLFEKHARVFIHSQKGLIKNRLKETMIKRERF
jgi:hypothetical protein